MSHVATKSSPQQLSREVLRWLQGLDLAYAVKNVRRDFSNGFLVAEMFSRYFPKLINMHSYDNGLRVAAREDNWHQLELVFDKVGFRVDNQEKLIESVMVSAPGASVQLVNAAYTFLTAREICTDTAPSVVTAASLRNRARERERKSKRFSEISDSRTEESKVSSPMSKSGASPRGPTDGSDHSSARAPALSGRSTASVSKGPSKLLRGENRPLAKVASQVQVKAGAVNIRSVESDIMSLRAAKRQSHIEPLGSGGSVAVHDALIDESKTLEGSTAESKSGATSSSSRSPMAVLEEAVAATLGPKSGFSIPNLLADLDCLVPGSVANPMLSDEELNHFVDSLHAQSEILMACVLEHLEQWVQIAPRLATVLIYRDNRVAGQILADVGGLLADEDSCAARAVFFDSILPALEVIMNNGMPQQRATAMAIYAAYCPPHDLIAQYDSLRTLQKRIRKQKTLLSCVVTFMNLAERDLSFTSSDTVCYFLVDLAVENLSHCSPSVRACALAILAGILERVDTVDDIATPDLLHQTAALASDSWWEVRIQLARLAVAANDSLLLHEALKEHGTFGESACKFLCCMLAPLLHERESLIPLFICCAANMSFEGRHEMLGSVEPESYGVFINSTNSVTQAAKEHVAVARSWDPALILNSLMNSNDGYSFNKVLESGEADVVHHLLLSFLQTEEAQDEDQVRFVWKEMFQTISGPLIRAIGDAKNSADQMQPLVSLVLDFCNSTAGLNVFAHPLWPEVLRKLYILDEESDETREGAQLLQTEVVLGMNENEHIAKQEVRISLQVLSEDVPDLAKCDFIKAILATKNSHK